VRLTHATQETLLADLRHRFRTGRGFALATLNLDHLVKLRRNPGFRAAYLAQTHVVADGNPVVWLHGLAGRKVGLVPGSELISPLAALAALEGVTVGLLGSTDEVLALASARLLDDHPGLRVVARLAPPQGFEPGGAVADAMLEELAASGARLCFLALGAPKQEMLAARGFAAHPGIGFVSIGAGLDFIAGAQNRAPPWVRRIAMEWAWRMMLSPRRLARRYLDCALILPGLALAARRQSQTRDPLQ
jgi:exopolysaccharide biosynthesis WecB/TagA/CpsF family protein